MKRPIIRSVKYFVAMTVLCTGLIAMLSALGTTASPGSWRELAGSGRYAELLAAIALLALFYPRFGFMTRRLRGRVDRNRDSIVRAFASAGFTLRSESRDRLVFRASGFPHKLMLLWEDEITVCQESPDRIAVEGIRRGVARTLYRMETYIRNEDENDE